MPCKHGQLDAAAGALWVFAGLYLLGHLSSQSLWGALQPQSPYLRGLWPYLRIAAVHGSSVLWLLALGWWAQRGQLERQPAAAASHGTTSACGVATDIACTVAGCRRSDGSVRRVAVAWLLCFFAGLALQLPLSRLGLGLQQLFPFSEAARQHYARLLEP
ncbi:MAG: hypothetical protein ACPGUV_11575, partial [Polyangiales bacterium]